MNSYLQINQGVYLELSVYIYVHSYIVIKSNKSLNVSLLACKTLCRSEDEVALCDHDVVRKTIFP